MMLRVRVIPNARKTEIVERGEDFFKIKLATPARDNKANKALVVFLAREFKIAKSAIAIIKGEKGRDKVVRIFVPVSI